MDRHPSRVRAQSAGDSFETIDAMCVIRAREAWQLATPDKGVIIAVLDDGVDARHPDLEAACLVAPAFHWGACPTGTTDHHGTACAGLAAACPGTPGGMRGVAGGCTILPLRIGSRGRDQPDATRINYAIDWAIQQGARIISLSWSYCHLDSVSNTIDEHAESALFVAAVGNEDGPVAFPASHPEVLAVSACNGHGEPKTPYSSDGEPWGTNHGPEVTLAAPGVALFTTDLAGRNGLSRGDHLYGFSGTSAAAALVAGAAALVFSCDRALPPSRVREILQETADKVGATYTNGHNEYMGYGRLNVEAAVKRTLGQA